MAKHKRGMTEEKIARWIKEGRGQGTGPNYRPWFEIQDVPSQGRVSRVWGVKASRLHHFLSKQELAYFHVLDLSPTVLDIREQYPLLPREATIAIAGQSGITHPRFGGVNMVLTTDFLVLVRTGSADKLLARTIKRSADLASDRVMEKLEIERLYWEARDIDWAIVTERDIPSILAANAELSHSYVTIADRVALDESKLLDVERELTRRVVRNDSPLRDICWQCDKDLGLSLGDCLAIAYHLIATWRWRVDMHTRIEPSKKLTLLSVDETLL